jgi:hypothetical protein
MQVSFCCGSEGWTDAQMFSKIHMFLATQTEILLCSWPGIYVAELDMLVRGGEGWVKSTGKFFNISDTLSFSYHTCDLTWK